jgi:hypothetical protein
MPFIKGKVANPLGGRTHKKRDEYSSSERLMGSLRKVAKKQGKDLYDLIAERALLSKDDDLLKAILSKLLPAKGVEENRSKGSSMVVVRSKQDNPQKTELPSGNN